MQTNVLYNQYLESDLYFYCDRCSCTMPKSDCIDRRKNLLKKIKYTENCSIGIHCYGCKQGEELSGIKLERLKCSVKGCKYAAEIDGFCEDHYNKQYLLKTRKSKECPRCHENKLLTTYSKKKDSVDGRQAICRQCTKEIDKERHAKEKEKKLNK